jgi:hypothetical protein
MMNFQDYKKQYERYLNLVVKYLQTYLLMTYLNNYNVFYDEHGKKNPKYHQAVKFLEYMFKDAYVDRTMDNLLTKQGSAVSKNPYVKNEYPYYHFFDPTHLDQIFLAQGLIEKTWYKFRQFIDHDYFRFIEKCMADYKNAETCYLELLPILCESIQLPMQDEPNGLDVADEYNKNIK